MSNQTAGTVSDSLMVAAPQIVNQIDSSDYYTLNVMRLPDVPQGNVYGVVNRMWGVIEMSSSLLSNAYEFFDELNKWSDQKFGRNLPELTSEPSPGLIS